MSRRSMSGVPLKVALVYPISFGEAGVYGGGERYALELAGALAEMADAVLVTLGSRRTSARRGRLRMEVHRTVAHIRGIHANALSVGFLRSLRGADVIHCLSYHTLMTDLAALYGRLSGKRVFITDIGGGGDLSLARWVNVAGMADGLLLLSEFAARQFDDAATPRRVIYGGVDVERFRPPGGVRRRQVLFVGRLLPHKGVDVLVEAIEPGIPLVVVGRPYDGAYFDHLKRRSVGKDVRFVLDASDEQIIDLYRSSTVAVLPSVYCTVFGSQAAAPELLGLTLLEAMACGTPVICTDVGAMPEVVANGLTGIVIPPNDPGALRARLREMVADPDQARRMGEAGRARVLDMFTWEKTARRCMEAYEELSRGEARCEVA